MSHNDDHITELAAYYDSTDTAELEGDDVPVEPTSRPMVSRSVRFERETMDELRAFADARGKGVTQLIREWVTERLADEQEPAENGTAARRLAQPRERGTECPPTSSLEQWRRYLFVHMPLNYVSSSELKQALTQLGASSEGLAVLRHSGRRLFELYTDHPDDFDLEAWADTRGRALGFEIREAS